MLYMHNHPPTTTPFTTSPPLPTNATHPPTTHPFTQLGESFGGVLALAVAAANPTTVDRIVLVNPATSFPRSPWPTLGPLLLSTPPEAYALLPFVLSPLLANPLNMMSRVVCVDCVYGGVCWLCVWWYVLTVYMVVCVDWRLCILLFIYGRLFVAG